MSIIRKLLGDFDFGQDTEQEPEVMELPEEQETKRLTGKIIRIDQGWGFIVSPEMRYTRIFFHWSALNQDTRRFTELEKGMRVEFEPMEVEGRGIRAIRIKVLD